ncbi:MAG: sugar kinase [Bacteroidaceae bacterium]
MKKVVTFGEALLRLSAPENLRFSQASEYTATYGGSELNVAASLANFGLPSEFVTRLPDNAIAKACLKDFRSHGLCTDGIVIGGHRMGIYFMESGAAFRNSTVVYDRTDSACSTLEPGMIDWRSIFKDAGWFHWSGVAAAISQSAADTCLEAIKIADSMGLTISCDLNYRKNLWNYGRKASDVMIPLVNYSHVLFGAEPEYEAILGVKPVGFEALDASYKLDLDGFEQYGKQLKTIVPHCKKFFLELRNTITSNHHTLAGVLYSDDSLKHTQIYDVNPVVDCVGTGDAFCGGLIAGLHFYPGNDQKALDFALAASAMKNTFKGDFNLASVDEVTALMDGGDTGKVQR